MFPLAILRAAQLVAVLNIQTTVLPNGDVERILIREVPAGVEAVVQATAAETGVSNVQRMTIPRGRYGWRIEEERRTVIKAAEGHNAGTVRRAYRLGLWVDATPNPNAPPNPIEAFHFYAPTREAAEALKTRLREALTARRP